MNAGGGCRSQRLPPIVRVAGVSALAFCALVGCPRTSTFCALKLSLSSQGLSPEASVAGQPLLVQLCNWLAVTILASARQRSPEPARRLVNTRRGTVLMMSSIHRLFQRVPPADPQDRQRWLLALRYAVDKDILSHGVLQTSRAKTSLKLKGRLFTSACFARVWVLTTADRVYSICYRLIAGKSLFLDD